jgi:ankyrin repeat protein
MKKLPNKLTLNCVFVLVLFVTLRVHSGIDEFHDAVRAGDLDKIQELTVPRPGIINLRNDKGMTPLHIAAVYNHTVAMERLLENGADVNARDTNAFTPLHAAAFHGHKQAVTMLLEKDADINAVDNHGWTPLHLAAFRNKKDIVDLLIVKKADLNVSDKRGMTPLHWSAF